MQRVREQVQVPEQIYSVTWRSEPVTVAVLDTGIAYHPDLAGHLLCFRDFVEKSSLPYDDNGHGTHVCGILCGNGELSGGRLRGMAPASKLVVGKVLDGKGEGSCDSMQEAFQWILRVKNRYQIRILNISVGIGELKERYKEQVLREYMELLWDHNILVVCAAGNAGPEDGSISEMASSRKVLTVGCHDGRYCKNDPKRCETYSGRGKNTTSSANRILWLPGRGSCPAMLSGEIEMAEFLNLILQKAVPPWQPPLCPERRHWYYKNIRECPMKNFSVG